jgi:hypothetical protein
VIDTAWAAVLLDRSTTTPTTYASRIGETERKECTLRAYFYFFFFLAVFFFAVFFAFFAFIVLSFHESPESRPGIVNVKIFARVANRIFPLTPIGVFDR